MLFALDTQNGQTLFLGIYLPLPRSLLGAVGPFDTRILLHIYHLSVARFNTKRGCPPVLLPPQLPPHLPPRGERLQDAYRERALY